MKKNIKNAFTFIAIVIVQFVTLAQTTVEPGDFGGGVNPTDTTTDTPIDALVWLLLVVGIVYVFYIFRSLMKCNMTTDF